MKNLLYLSVFSLFLFSCSNAHSNENAGSPENITEEITTLETEYGANPGKAIAQIGPLLAKYEEYVALPTGDEKMKVDYLLRAGEMAALINQYDKSLAYYGQILTDFPNSPKAATALFMQGYTLDDKLKKLDEAKAIYESFLQKYPNDDFADDAKFLLDNLGKSEEEIIKQFEANK